MKQTGNFKAIWDFIEANHVIGITTVLDEEMWSASLFYVPDPKKGCVWVMTDENTIHGSLMSSNPRISGTISTQESHIHLLKGIQFSGEIAMLKSGPDYKDGLWLYQQKFPVALVHKKPLWKLSFTKIKYTNNALGFGTKLLWEKETIHE